MLQVAAVAQQDKVYTNHFTVFRTREFFQCWKQLRGPPWRGRELPSLPVSFDGNTEVVSLMIDGIGYRYGPVLAIILYGCNFGCNLAQECN